MFHFHTCFLGHISSSLTFVAETNHHYSTIGFVLYIPHHIHISVPALLNLSEFRWTKTVNEEWNYDDIAKECI